MKALFDQTKITKYYVSKNGKIFSSCSRNKKHKLFEKTPTLNKKRGYFYVRTKSGNYSLHRLVASAFIENKLNKPCVNHIDGNKLNNHSSNLEWVTHKENSAHAKKNGLVTYFKKNEGPKIKYSAKQIKDVWDRAKKGMTYVEAGSIHKMPYSTVAHLMRGSRRKI